MATVDVPQLTKTDEIATGANGKRARDELPTAAPLVTKLGTVRIQGSSMGTRAHPRYVELEFARDTKQREVATLRFPEASLKDFHIDAKERRNAAAGTTFIAREVVAPWTRDELGTRSEFGDFAQGEAERLMSLCEVGGRTPVDLVLARFPELATAVPAWDAGSVGLSRFMRATKTAMSVWSKGTYGPGAIPEMKEQDPFSQAQAVSTSETPGEEGVFLVPVFSGGKFAQRKATLKKLEAVVIAIKYSDLDGGKDGTRSASVYFSPTVTAMDFELM